MHCKAISWSSRITSCYFCAVVAGETAELSSRAPLAEPAPTKLPSMSSNINKTKRYNKISLYQNYKQETSLVAFFLIIQMSNNRSFDYIVILWMYLKTVWLERRCDWPDLAPFYQIINSLFKYSY